MVRASFVALLALAVFEGTFARQPQPPHQLKARDGHTGHKHERSLPRGYRRHIQPQHLEKRHDEDPKRSRRDQVTDALKERQLLNNGADPALAGTNNLQADGAAVVNPAAQAAAGNGDFFVDNGFVAGQTQQFGEFFEGTQPTQTVAAKERRQVINGAGNAAAGNGDFFVDDGFLAGNTDAFGEFFEGTQPTQAPQKERRQVLDGAGNAAAGNGDFFVDGGFQAANTAPFGEFFQGTQPTQAAAKKERRQVLDGVGNAAAGNGDFFVDDGFQAANTAPFGEFFQDGNAPSPTGVQSAAANGQQDLESRGFVGDVLGGLFGDNGQQQQQEQNNGALVDGQLVNEGFFGAGATGGAGVLNPFGQEDGTLQGQTGLFGDFFGSGTNQNTAQNTNNINTNTVASVAVSTESVVESVDAQSQVSTTVARSTASQVETTTKADTTEASVVSSNVETTADTKASDTVGSVQSADAVVSDTASAVKSASEAASAGTNSVGGIGANFVSTGSTSVEAASATESAEAQAAAETESVESADTSASSSISGDLTNVQAAADTAETSAYQLPGRQLQVLPIGLGVFGGVSVIALIVVGVVTYERKKYRKQYRERKDAEMSSRPMQEAKV